MKDAEDTKERETEGKGREGMKEGRRAKKQDDK